MKTSFLLSMLLFVSTLFTKGFANINLKMQTTGDTTKPIHITDGVVSEWQASQFTNDKETGISTAVDNDNSQLFVALKVNNMNSIAKIMGLGMNIFIDLKGKHRESTTIEYPIKASASQIIEFARKFKDGNGKNIKVDDAIIKNEFLTRMAIMKTSGLTGQDEDKLYGLINDNGLTVAFSIDETNNNLFIEYAIPFQLLDASAGSLTGKKISIGLRLNAPDLSALQQRQVISTQVVSSSQLVGVVSNSSSPRIATGRASNLLDPPGTIGNAASRSPLQETYIWTKYDMKF
jgi:hypothetical protein